MDLRASVGADDDPGTAGGIAEQVVAQLAAREGSDHPIAPPQDVVLDQHRPVPLGVEKRASQGAVRRHGGMDVVAPHDDPGGGLGVDPKRGARADDDVVGELEREVSRGLDHKAARGGERRPLHVERRARARMHVDRQRRGCPEVDDVAVGNPDGSHPAGRGGDAESASVEAPRGSIADDRQGIRSRQEDTGRQRRGPRWDDHVRRGRRPVPRSDESKRDNSRPEAAADHAWLHRRHDSTSQTIQSRAGRSHWRAISVLSCRRCRYRGDGPPTYRSRPCWRSSASACWCGPHSVLAQTNLTATASAGVGVTDNVASASTGSAGAQWGALWLASAGLDGSWAGQNESHDLRYSFGIARSFTGTGRDRQTHALSWNGHYSPNGISHFLGAASASVTRLDAINIPTTNPTAMPGPIPSATTFFTTMAQPGGGLAADAAPGVDRDHVGTRGRAA